MATDIFQICNSAGFRLEREIKKFLLEQMGNQDANQKKAEIAYEVLRNNFGKKVAFAIGRTALLEMLQSTRACI